jgi:hypothetical protein
MIGREDHGGGTVPTNYNDTTRQWAAVVGDVIASRSEVDQAGLLSNLEDVLAAVNSEVAAWQPLQITIGDEFQGAYETIEKALCATLLVLLNAKGFREIRFGIGWGSISVSERNVMPLGQSGSSWWNARDAIDELKRDEKRNKYPKTVRTRFKGDNRSQTALVNSFLATRDHILSRMDLMDARIALLLRQGTTQAQIADVLGTSQSNISRRANDNGPMTLVWVLHQFERQTL